MTTLTTYFDGKEHILAEEEVVDYARAVEAIDAFLVALAALKDLPPPSMKWGRMLLSNSISTMLANWREG